MEGNEPASRATISSFFQSAPLKSKAKKRGASPTGAIDLTADSDGEPPVKKSRRNGPASQKTGSPSGAAEQWRFTPTSPDKAESHTTKVKEPTEAEAAAKKARREAFKKKLLLENNRFIRKESDTTMAPIEEAPIEISGGESDSAFKELNLMFSNKGKGKARAPMTAKQPKKALVLGPSGQSYTPLELQVNDVPSHELQQTYYLHTQVLALKKEHPETVLMVEVGYKYKFFGDDAKVSFR
jgi:DNA mismatch repair protein MSH3